MPFDHMKFLDGGLDIALVKNNARLGAQIAVSLSQLREENRKGDSHSSVIFFSFTCNLVKIMHEN